MSPPPGEPRESTKPQPIGSILMIVLLTTCMLCFLFLLWRRADSLRSAVSHQLMTLTRSEGRIRLSEDNGPPANEFLADDYDEDNEHLNDLGNETLTDHIRKATEATDRTRL